MRFSGSDNRSYWILSIHYCLLQHALMSKEDALERVLTRQKWDKSLKILRDYMNKGNPCRSTRVRIGNVR